MTEFVALDVEIVDAPTQADTDDSGLTKKSVLSLSPVPLIFLPFSVIPNKTSLSF